jgi:hypothetical protein
MSNGIFRDNRSASLAASSQAKMYLSSFSSVEGRETADRDQCKVCKGSGGVEEIFPYE